MAQELRISVHTVHNRLKRLVRTLRKRGWNLKRDHDLAEIIWALDRNASAEVARDAHASSARHEPPPTAD
jgi:hypothetical protein